MPRSTTTASTTELTKTSRTLMLAFELGEESWLLGFSAGFGEKVLRRKIKSRDIDSLLCEIERARRHFGLPNKIAVKSCYEAGRDGFWLHRCLECAFR